MYSNLSFLSGPRYWSLSLWSVPANALVDI
jgi:hypothetical protein